MLSLLLVIVTSVTTVPPTHGHLHTTHYWSSDGAHLSEVPLNLTKMSVCISIFDVSKTPKDTLLSNHNTRTVNTSCKDTYLFRAFPNVS